MLEIGYANTEKTEWQLQDFKVDSSHELQKEEGIIMINDFLIT